MILPEQRATTVSNSGRDGSPWHQRLIGQQTVTESMQVPITSFIDFPVASQEPTLTKSSQGLISREAHRLSGETSRDATSIQDRRVVPDSRCSEY